MPPAGQTFHLSREIFHHLLDRLAYSVQTFRVDWTLSSAYSSPVLFALLDDCKSSVMKLHPQCPDEVELDFKPGVLVIFLI